MPGAGQLRASLSLALVLMAGAPSLALLQPFLPEGPMLLLFLGGLAGLLALSWAHTRRFQPDRALGSEWLLMRVQAPWARAGAPARQAPPALLSLRLAPRCPAWAAPGRTAWRRSPGPRCWA